MPDECFTVSSVDGDGVVVGVGLSWGFDARKLAVVFCLIEWKFIHRRNGA